MALYKNMKSSYFKFGAHNATVLVNKDGRVSQQDLEKLNLDSLYYLARYHCRGSLRDVLIEYINGD